MFNLNFLFLFENKFVLRENEKLYINVEVSKLEKGKDIERFFLCFFLFDCVYFVLVLLVSWKISLFSSLEYKGFWKV